MEMTFQSDEHGTLKTEAWSVALRGDQPQGSIAFTVPEERKPETHAPGGALLTDAGTGHDRCAA